MVKSAGRWLGAGVLLLATAGWSVTSPTPVPPGGAGICPDLGCIGGETKCATGSYTNEDGLVVNYTCYTTINPQ